MENYLPIAKSGLQFVDMMAKLAKYFSLTACLCLILGSLGLPVKAAGAAILITEIQAGSSASANEEFIELFNASLQSIDINGWRLEYYSANKTDFSSLTQAIALSVSLQPQHYYLLAAKNYLTGSAQSFFNPTMAASGGVLRLAKPDSSMAGKWGSVDLVGWGTALLSATKLAPAAPAGSSLRRRPTAAGSYLASGNNSADFTVDSRPSPGRAPSLVSEPAPPPDSGLPPPPAGGTPAPTSYAKPLISELFPNPASPQLDANDEFFELFNPTAETIDLTGYSVDAGVNWSSHYKFKTASLAANSYQAYMSSQTGLTLTNAGGQIRLKDPAGQIISQPPAYGPAAAGQAWAQFGPDWQWTTQPTPGSPNLLIKPLPIIGAVKPKTPGASAKSPKASTTKAAKSTAVPAKAALSEFAAINPSTSATHWLVIAVIGAGAVLYAGYEYRRDLRNKLRQFRIHRKAR